MSVRSLLFTIFFFLFLLPGTVVFAQQEGDTIHTAKKDTLFTKAADTSTAIVKKGDTLILNSNVADTSGKNLLASDTSKTKKYNPRKATLRSLIIPGWGQWTNKKYWKIPIVYGALGITAGVFFYNLKTYKLLRQGVIYRASGTSADSLLVDPQFRDLSTQSIVANRDIFRQNIDYSVLVFLVFWGLNVVDATVDAHLKEFDVSSDIGMRIHPGFNYITSSPGLSLVFFFREKNNKPVMPLP